ncbi:hypothetical protein V8B97DRAFT_1915123 [Scleroderma yunnanense]
MLHSMVLLYYVTIVAGCQRIMEGCEQEASLQMIAYVRSTENLQCSIDYDFTPRALPDVLFCFMGTLEVLKATAQSGDVWVHPQPTARKYGSRGARDQSNRRGPKLDNGHEPKLWQNLDRLTFRYVKRDPLSRWWKIDRKTVWKVGITT